MPCRYEESDAEKAASAAESEKVRNRKLDKLTRMLCWLCNRVENDLGLTTLIRQNDELDKWWTSHKKSDAKKAALEIQSKRKVALDKLTPEERTLLGVTS